HKNKCIEDAAYLESGASLDAKDKDVVPLLMLRIKMHGTKDEDGNTPLHLAAQHQGTDVCKLLIDSARTVPGCRC
ncbi:hypothetical protein L9F63_027190, partial [Diploptera punctata]